MENWDYRRTWYHGSQQEITTLRIGSSITQEKAIACAFSHRPSLISISDAGSIKHDGVVPGYLYVVSEEIDEHDVEPHPHPSNVTRWEWLTKRELHVRLVEHTYIPPEEQLTEDEIISLRRKQRERSEQR
ncbi:hypothetical protein [Dictyobacter aurantiacus]|uniref:Uncharacterized protein n=1 Tax=Dictyobacter aurantiacus TaxID=1936993 RepID=A0A401ZQH4_9CHLR|nr:hypothetical protein [Dictyobacter aurantiacus]GCE09121.1 hypothetical protein KDAU_64500 [Dictyobacter aurantiacus]